MSKRGRQIGLGLMAVWLLAGSMARAQDALPGIVIMEPPSGPSPGASGLPPGYPAPGPTPPYARPMPAPGAANSSPQTGSIAPSKRSKPTSKRRKPRKPRKVIVKRAKPTPPKPRTRSPRGGNRIALLVNGDPITAYEIEQRARLLSLRSDIPSRAQATMKRYAKSDRINKQWRRIVEATIRQYQHTKTREQIIAIIKRKQKAFGARLRDRALSEAKSSVLPTLRKKARTELIEEKVKLQAAKREGISVNDRDVNAVIKKIASGNNTSLEKFIANFRKMGIGIEAFKSRIRAQQAFVMVARRKFSHYTRPGARDVDRLLSKEVIGPDEVQLQLQRIVIPLPRSNSQRAVAQRLLQAEQLQADFRSCRSMRVMAAKISGARFQDMGTRRASNFKEPTRTLLKGANNQELLPPRITSGGIELLAVCNRSVVKAKEVRRSEKIQELRQAKFDRMSRKYLRDLLENAIIEDRTNQ